MGRRSLRNVVLSRADLTFLQKSDTSHPEVPNPWLGVTLETRIKKTKPAVTRDQVYDFAHGSIAEGEPEVAAVAVICFEWLQRPENVIAGHIKWTDYRAPSTPNIIRVAHHKTGTIAPHPLEETEADGTVVKFYRRRRGSACRPAPPRRVDDLARGIQRHRQAVRVPDDAAQGSTAPEKTETAVLFHARRLPAWRMTELEEAELTDGQGRALSTHKTQQSYEGYAKRTSKRMLSATRKRHAHRLTGQKNEPATSVQNGAADCCSERRSAKAEKRLVLASRKGESPHSLKELKNSRQHRVANVDGTTLSILGNSQNRVELA